MYNFEIFAKVIMIIIFGMDLGINLANHKKKKEGSSAEYNFWITLIAVISEAVILHVGGFW